MTKMTYQFDADLFRKILVSAKNTTLLWDGLLYFVYLPSWERFSDPNLANPYRDQVLDLLNSLEIPAIDIYETFSTHGDPLSFFPFRLSVHYTEEGYRLVAETILQFIVDKDVSIL